MIHYMSVNGIEDAWVANELRQVQFAKVPFVLNSLRKPLGTFHEAEWANEINQETRTIYPITLVPFLKSLFLGPFLFRSRYIAALSNAIFGRRESFRVRMVVLAHFFVATYWATGLRSERISLIHSQWIHSGGTVAMYGAWLLDVPFSFTGHAVDLFRQRAALDDKIRRASFIICISEFHRQFYLENGARPDQLTIAYCGIDLGLFRPIERNNESEVFTIVSGGRLVEKKGFGFLIKACEELKRRGRTLKCIIGGSGPLEADLREQVRKAGLEADVTLTGEALTQEGIPDFMAQGDVFCLPCVWTRDNDVDGLPQLLMEAMACGLPVISTQLVGIPDLIKDGETGLLVSPENAEELADVLELAMDDRKKLGTLVAGGHRHLAARFDLNTCLEPLLERFRTYLDKTDE